MSSALSPGSPAHRLRRCARRSVSSSPPSPRRFRWRCCSGAGARRPAGRLRGAMCTILLAWRVVPGAPIVLAANRDELLERPTLPPHVLVERPLIAGGQDELAGGTWMAVRADGAVAAVTNRRSEFRDPLRRSRGELPLALLQAGGDAEATGLLDRPAAHDYNPFNALYVSPQQAAVAEAHGDALALQPLQPGLHVLTVFDLDDRAQRKVDYLCKRLQLAAGAAQDDAGALLDGMEAILRDHGEPG